ncbi:hypothetical protein [Chitinophaga sp. 212800010-3]|uniref:hypothetical protein n=1 Tax=unclassified Chitinophaga TaxID=2619133 RepID=UPI002DF5C3EE|nr:LPD25 domain-containing protein [Chitinophaga sp. 212800010-3]
MKIYISEEALVNEIQQTFHRLYPHLRLEFFHRPHKLGACSPKEDRVMPDMPIEKIRMIHSFGWIDIGPNRTAAEVERDFAEQFGLNVQVMRQVNTLWLTTTATDHRTLGNLEDGGRPGSIRFQWPEAGDNDQE